MNEETPPGVIFRRVHRVLKAIHLCNEQLEKLPKQIKTLQNRLIGSEKQKTDALDLIKKSKVEQHQAEVSLKQFIALKDKYVRQQDEASDPKVFEALSHELATAKTNIDQTEETVLNLMTRIDETTAKLPDLEKAIVKAREELAGFDKEAAARKLDLEAQVKDHQAKLATLEPLIPAEHSAWYFRSKKATFHDGLSSVENKTCTACGTAITNQMQNDINNYKFVSCKACGRIVYLPGTD